MELPALAIGRMLQVEIHICSDLKSSGAAELERDGSARVTHMVLRLDACWWTIGKAHFLGNLLTSIDQSIARLPFLQAVTLETTSNYMSATLMEKLPLLQGSGRLRRRSCKEAQEIAREALSNPGGYSVDQGICSPLWLSNMSNGLTGKTWCDIFSVLDPVSQRHGLTIRSIIPSGCIPWNVKKISTFLGSRRYARIGSEHVIEDWTVFAGARYPVTTSCASVHVSHMEMPADAKNHVPKFCLSPYQAHRRTSGFSQDPRPLRRLWIPAAVARQSQRLERPEAMYAQTELIIPKLDVICDRSASFWTSSSSITMVVVSVGCAVRPVTVERI